MPFKHQNFQVAVPRASINLWTYDTEDTPEEIEQSDYFDKAAGSTGIMRLDLVTVIAEAHRKRPAVTDFLVNEVGRNRCRLMRVRPWAQAGAAPGSEIPSDEHSMLDAVAKAIAKMPQRHFSTDGRPNRSILAGRLGWSPSPEIVDRAMSLLQDQHIRKLDAEQEEAERTAAAEQAEQTLRPPEPEPETTAADNVGF